MDNKMEILLDTVNELLETDTETYNKIKTAMMQTPMKEQCKRYSDKLFAYIDSIRPQGTTKAL